MVDVLSHALGLAAWRLHAQCYFLEGLIWRASSHLLQHVPGSVNVFVSVWVCVSTDSGMCASRTSYRIAKMATIVHLLSWSLLTRPVLVTNIMCHVQLHDHPSSWSCILHILGVKMARIPCLILKADVPSWHKMADCWPMCHVLVYRTGGIDSPTMNYFRAVGEIKRRSN